MKQFPCQTVTACPSVWRGNGEGEWERQFAEIEYSYSNYTYPWHTFPFISKCITLHWHTLLHCTLDKGSKCQALAIEASTRRVYDPDLSVTSGKIPFAGRHSVRFLGGTIKVPIKVPRNPDAARDAIKEKLVTLLARVDAVPVTWKQKLKAVVGPYHHRIFSLLVGKDPRFNGDPLPQEVGWLSKTSRPCQALSTTNQWQLQPTPPFYLVSEISSGKGQSTDHIKRCRSQSCC